MGVPSSARASRCRAAGIVFVPFQRLRDALLIDEDRAPDRGEARCIARPVGFRDRECRHVQPRAKRRAARWPRAALHAAQRPQADDEIAAGDEQGLAVVALR